jgi:hypothetical protein
MKSFLDDLASSNNAFIAFTFLNSVLDIQDFDLVQSENILQLLLMQN